MRRLDCPSESGRIVFRAMCAVWFLVATIFWSREGLAQRFGDPAEIRVAEARVRSEPTILAGVLRTLLRGTVVRITAPGEVWSFIEFGELRGYVRTEQLLLLAPPPPPVDSIPPAPVPIAQSRAGGTSSWARGNQWTMEVSGFQRRFPLGPSAQSAPEPVRIGSAGAGLDLQLRVPINASLSVGLGGSVSRHANARLLVPDALRSTIGALFVEPRVHWRNANGWGPFLLSRVAVQSLRFARQPSDSMVASALPYETSAGGTSLGLGGGVERTLGARSTLVVSGSYAFALTRFRDRIEGSAANVSDPLLGASELTLRFGAQVAW